jgi:lambda family phage portal protein
MGILDRILKRSSGYAHPTVPTPEAPRPVMTALPPRRSAEGNVSITPTPDKRIPMKRIMQAAGTGRLEQSWTSTPTTVDSWIYQHWNTLVARSREQAENNDHAKKFVQLCRDNIAGPNGFVLMANIKDPNGAVDKLASDAIEDAFKRFSKRGKFTVCKGLSRQATERLIAATLPKDGEFIAIARYGKNLNEFGFAIQIIDPVLLDPTHYVDLGNGNTIRHGIEFDSNGAPVAYHFRKMDERQMGYITGMTRDTDRVPAENVCHVMLPEIVGQKRGLPWMRTALWRMRMLGGFEDAALVNARVGAAKMGFFRNQDGDDVEADELPLDGDPGTFEDIGNREFVQFSPQFPEQTIDPFTKSMLRSIASGLNVSYNNLASDLTSVNFSSIRQGALDEREVWKGLQELLIEQWSEWVYDRWLQRALVANAITVAGKPLRFDRLEKYRAVSWQGRRWGWIDPQAEMAANEKAIAMRIKTRSEVIRETSGRDGGDVWAEFSRDDADMASFGVTPEPPPGSPMTAPPPNNSNDQTE